MVFRAKKVHVEVTTLTMHKHTRTMGDSKTIFLLHKVHRTRRSMIAPCPTDVFLLRNATVIINPMRNIHFNCNGGKNTTKKGERNFSNVFVPVTVKEGLTNFPRESEWQQKNERQSNPSRCYPLQTNRTTQNTRKYAH